LTLLPASEAPDRDIVATSSAGRKEKSYGGKPD
jgi:hypothetical protein